MFNHFNLLNLFRENRPVFMAPRRAGAAAKAKAEAVAQPDITAEKPEEEKGEGKKAEVKAETKKELAKEKKDVEKETTRAKVKKEMADLKGTLKRLDINKAREDAELDPTTFDISNEEGLKKVVDIFIYKLGLDRANVRWMEDNLKLAFSQEILKKPNPADATMLQNPEGNETRIGDEYPDFYLALQYYKTVRDTLVEQRKYQETGIENRQKMNEDPVFNKATTYLQGAYDRLMTAVENRDYATMGMYAAGFYCIYKVWNQIAAHKTGGAIKTALIWGTAIYAGTHILAPDVAKKIFGGGTSTDIKGTALENLKNLGEKGFQSMKEMTTAALVAPAKVKDIFEPLVADPKSTKYEMIQLTNPGIAKCFPELAGIGPLYPDSKKHFSAQEDLYIETAKILYRNALALKEAWQNKVQPREKVSFDKRFLDKDSANYTMEQLYDALTPYAANYRETIFSAAVGEEARKDLYKVFKESDNFNIVGHSGTNKLPGTMMGFPIVVRRNDNAATDVREYRISLASDPDKIVATVVPDDLDSIESARKDLREAITQRMRELLSRVSISNDTATEKVHYDGKNWVAREIMIAGVEEFGIKAHPENIIVYPHPDGRSIEFKMLGSGAIVIVDEKLVEHYQISIPVLADLMQQKEFRSLNVFYKQRTVEFEDPEPGDHKFVLKIAGIPLEFTCDPKAKENKYILENPEKVEDLIQTREFQDAYIEARAASEEFKVFDEMKVFVKENMPESTLGYFGEYGVRLVTGSMPAPYQGLSTDVFSGSIPNNYTYMLVDAKKNHVLGLLRHGLKDCKSFDDINEKEGPVNTVLQKIDAQFAYLMQNQDLMKKGKNWGRGEFMREVIDPLKDAGTESRAYKVALRRFESAMFSELGLGGSDWREELHLIAGKLFNVYFYNTSHLDSPELDRQPTDSERKSGILVPIESRKRENYFYYVERTIVAKTTQLFATGGRSVNAIYSASDVGWGIMDYKTWESEHRDVTPLDPMDSEPPLEHDRSKVTRKEGDKDIIDPTPLEDELEKRYRDSAQKCIDDIGEYNPASVVACLNDVLGVDNKGEVTKDYPQYMQDADNIAASSPRTQKEQEVLIRYYVERFEKRVESECRNVPVGILDTAKYKARKFVE